LIESGDGGEASHTVEIVIAGGDVTQSGN